MADESISQPSRNPKILRHNDLKEEDYGLRPQVSLSNQPCSGEGFFFDVKKTENFQGRQPKSQPLKKYISVDVDLNCWGWYDFVERDVYF